MSSSVPHLLVFSLHPFPPPPPPHRAHSTIYYLWLIRFLIHCLVFLLPLSFLSSLSRSFVLIRLPSCRSSCLSLSLFLSSSFYLFPFPILTLYIFILSILRFASKESATQAIVSVHNTDLNGQNVKCSWGKEPGEPGSANNAQVYLNAFCVSPLPRFQVSTKKCPSIYTIRTTCNSIDITCACRGDGESVDGK